MRNWLTSLNAKKHQRKINRYVRDMNKNIAQDNLWQGRFYMRQIDSPKFHIYSDKSGAELYVRFRLYDKKTDLTQDTRYDSVNSWIFLNGWRIFRVMNDFINEVEYE